VEEPPSPQGILSGDTIQSKRLTDHELSRTAVRPSREHIAQRAYALYEAGGFQPGKEIEYWLEAERQLQAEQQDRVS
jgi:hypothetical protein